MKASLRHMAMAAMLGLAALPQAQAQLLDEIELSQDRMEARIQFNAPVHYLRHFPVGNAQTFEIFFQLISREGADHMPSDEYKIAPPSDRLPRFTVTYPKQGASRLIVQFCRTVDLKVRLGEDNRSLVLSIRPADAPISQPVTGPNKPDTKNAAPDSDAAAPPAETPAAVSPIPAAENSNPASEGSK